MLSSKPRCYRKKPSITSFFPSKGTIGTPVTISGNNFSATATNNIVYFGDVKAVVTNASANSLTAIVPAGATFRPLSVTVNGLTSYSSTPFNITFAGGSSSFTTNSFSPRFDSLLNYNPTNLGTSDLDGDGKLDVVIVGAAANVITVLKNNSTIASISFLPKVNYVSSNSPVAVAFGDLDGDGKQDLLVVNSKANTLSIFKNNSTSNSISFLPKVDIVTGSSPAYCYVSDIDNDGKPDVVSTNSDSNTISVFRNITAAGSAIAFASKIDFITGKNPIGIVAVDLDGDALPEIAVANENNASISVYRNKSTPGTISFDTKVDYPDPYKPTQLFAADLDGDGKIDLVAGSDVAPAFSVIKNKSYTGNIGFDAAVSFPTGFGASSTLSVGDADGDGEVDIAVNHDFYSTISLVRNLGKPDTLVFGARTDYLVGSTSVTVLQADLDGDGRQELISGNVSQGSVSFFRNIVTKPYITSISPMTAGNGSVVTITGNNFTTASAVRFGGVPASSFFVESPKIITAIVDTGASGEVIVTTTYGVARFTGFTLSHTPTITSFTPTAGSTGTVLAIIGTNLGGTNVVTIGGVPVTSSTAVSSTVITATVGTLLPGTFDVTVTNAFGTVSLPGFYTGITINNFYPTSGPVGTIVTITGTHFSNVPSNNIVYFGTVRAPVLASSTTLLSVVVPTGTSYQPISVTTDSLTAYSIQPFLVTFKGTNNEFTLNSFIDVLDSSAGGFPVYTSIRDLNDDGKPDIIMSNTLPASIAVAKNTTSNNIASFQRKVEFATDNYVLSTATGDLDGDGKPDIVALTAQNGVSLDRSITVFKNISTSDSILLTKTVYPIGTMNNNPAQCVIADFDDDGKSDIAVLTYATISILKNTSTASAISFSPKVDLLMFGQSLASSIVIADVDGDGKVDIIATDRNLQSAYVFRNNSRPSQILFGAKVSIETGFSPSGVFLTDLDNDGLPDMIVTNAGNNSVSTYKNKSKVGSISFDTRVTYQLDVMPDNMGIGDLDGDGRPDLVIVTNRDKFVYVLKNTTVNGSASFANKISYTGGLYTPGRVFIADISGDGKPDIVTNNPGGNNFSVYLNKCKDDSLSAASIAALGPTELCEGGSVTLKTNLLNGATYQWYKDGTAIAAANDSVFAANAPGNYSITIMSNGIITTSAVIRISVKQAPPAPIVTPQGTSNFCEGSGLFLYSSAKGGNQWYKDNISIASSTDTAYRVASSGTYKVITSSNGCSGASSNQITVVATPSPPASIFSSGPSFCDGDSITLIANNITGLSYQWSINEEVIPGVVSSLLVTKIPGRYSVTTSNSGCSTMSQAISILNIASPAKPSITQTGSQLTSSSATGNQWYVNGVLITGATEQTYTLANNGNYSVQVTSSGCKSPMSEIISFLVTGIGTIDNIHFIKLSPNPVGNQMKFDFKLNVIPLLNLDLINLNGRVIQRWENLKSGVTLDVSLFSNAIYLARIYSSDGKVNVILKILKQ